MCDIANMRHNHMKFPFSGNDAIKMFQFQAIRLAMERNSYTDVPMLDARMADSLRRGLRRWVPTILHAVANQDGADEDARAFHTEVENNSLRKYVETLEQVVHMSKQATGTRTHHKQRRHSTSKLLHCLRSCAMLRDRDR